MKTQLSRFVALTIVVTTLACSDATGVEPDDLAGTWNTTSALEDGVGRSSRFFRRWTWWWC